MGLWQGENERVQEAAAGRLIRQASAPRALERKDEKDPVVDLIRVLDLAGEPRVEGEVRRIHEREGLQGRQEISAPSKGRSFLMARQAEAVAHCPEPVDLGDIPGDLGDDPDADAEKEARQQSGMQRIRLGIGVPACRHVLDQLLKLGWT